MAEKKDLRDYLVGNTTGENTRNTTKKTLRDYLGSNVSSAVGNNITSRVNALFQNHSTYISDYQKRYSGRNGTVEDSYVSDSADWLDTVSKQKSAFDAEAYSIIAYMDQYRDYLDADWMSSIKKAISGSI